jgi:AmmeMemoRadiSam system protein A/AmmeMemoRadiSam system protein B
MGNESAIVFSGIAPHPPIMVPEVGGEAIEDVRGSITAMEELTRRVIECGAITIVLVSPHAPLDAKAFVAYQTPLLHGDFADFRAPAATVEFPLDGELLQAIKTAAADEDYAVTPIKGQNLDHGSAVPLYFLQRNGWSGSVVGLGYSFLSNEDHLNFGACIRQAVDRVGRSVAFIASGDLSHRLKPSAPAGYNHTAYLFDAQVVEALHDNAAGRIIDIDQDLRRRAGECGYRSMLVVLGATRELPGAAEVLHYEAPFGVGYLVAQLTNSVIPTNSAVPTNSTPAAKNEAAEPSSDSAADESLVKALPSLARQAVETFVLTGKCLSVPPATGIVSVPAACFVSIKTRSGDLRGCIGTIEPTNETLAEEVILNAVNAATRDPRFKPVTADELAGLRYSVDILGATEPATLEDLDPATYGVIVEDEASRLRALLLPDIEGVDTVDRQVGIAMRKAGIPPGTPVKLSRFLVQRFRE